VGERMVGATTAAEGRESLETKGKRESPTEDRSEPPLPFPPFSFLLPFSLATSPYPA